MRYLLIIFVCLASPLLAQEPMKIPTLNEHTFSATGIVGSPFINSNLQMGLGFASSTSVEVPLFVIDGQEIQGEIGGILTATLNFRYKQKVKDWMAFSINPIVTTRLGTDVTTLLTSGINTVSGVNFEWLIRLHHSERSMLSASLATSSFSGNFISISRFVEDVINNVPNPGLARTIPAVNSGFGLRWAYGLSKVTGFQVSGDLRYGEGFSRTGAGLSYKVGALADFNFANTTNTPIALSAWYFISTQPENVYQEIQSTSVFGSKITYMGTNDFVVGLELAYLRVPVGLIDSKIGVAGTVLTINYYFN